MQVCYAKENELSLKKVGRGGRWKRKWERKNKERKWEGWNGKKKEGCGEGITSGIVVSFCSIFSNAAENGT